MARKVKVAPRKGLADYEAVAHLAPAVHELREMATGVVERLRGRTVWMVNSTEQGGGVAEMLPGMLTLLRELGFSVEWVVLETDREPFFHLTKNIHNLLHGAGTPELGEEHRKLYETVQAENAAEMRGWLSPGDLLVVHDPQPMGLAGALSDVPLATVWRCHIGLDDVTPETEAAWSFLAPYASDYKRAVFSAPEYIPDLFRRKASIIFPAIDPLAHKNRELSLHKTAGVLSNSALSVAPGPVLTPMYDRVAERLQPQGHFAPANMAEDIGLLTRPIVTQISRWDRLKGWFPLMEAFARMKEESREDGRSGDLIHRRRMELVRLVLAGPEPASVEDDPEGKEVLRELCGRYLALPPHVQRDIAILALPMTDLSQNALMVNALQRASTVVAQNSLREGFGLTVTEGMWKGAPILSNRRACGPRQQVRDGVDGRLVSDPEDVREVCDTLDAMLRSPDDRDTWGRNARRHVHTRFLLFSQLRDWIHLLEEVALT